jgi:hypothetical protein
MKDNLLDGEYLITKDYTDWMVKTGGFSRDMALRDYFAGLAMQNFAEHVGSQSDQYYFEQVAEGAYRMADAMLKERTK